MLYGKESLADLLDLVKDVVKLDPDTRVLTCPLDEELDNAGHLIKLTEDSRRERQRRIDAGDETARLKFQNLVKQQEALKAAEEKKKQAEALRKKQAEEAKAAAAAKAAEAGLAAGAEGAVGRRQGCREGRRQGRCEGRRQGHGQGLRQGLGTAVVCADEGRADEGW